MKPLRVLIYGAGAIGGYIGASLGARGHQISFIELAATIPLLSKQGIHLERPDGALHIKEAEFFASAQEALDDHSFDVAVFALKSFDTASALKALRTIKGALPPILCLQNGVDNEAEIGEIVGAENVISGTVTTAIGKKGIGKLNVERLRGIGIGAEHPLSKRITEALDDAGLKAKSYPNSQAMKWSKLLTNLLTNAQCAIEDMDPKKTLSSFPHYQIEIEQLREAIRVMDTLSLKVVDLPGTPVRALAFAAKRLPMRVSQPLIVRAAGSGRGGKMPSLHIDRFSGRGLSEVGWLNGAVAHWGEKLGIPTPVNADLNMRLQELVNVGK